jgi:hypothetical protein
MLARNVTEQFARSCVTRQELGRFLILEYSWEVEVAEPDGRDEPIAMGRA